MAIYWPEDLPMGIKYGADTELGKSAKISSDMDYGNKKRRRRFTNVPSYQTVQMKFTDAQYEQFAYFYINFLRYGTASFYTKVITPAGIEQLRCTIDDDSISIVHQDYNYHLVSFTLEIYDITGPVVSEGTIWLIGLYGEDFIINNMVNPIHNAVHVQYPEAVEDYS